MENEIDQQKLIEAIKADVASGNLDLLYIPDFGLWNPSIKEAAELVAVDMWFSGEIEGVKEPEDFDGDGRAQWLKVALADNIAAFEAKLSAAVDSGRLKASPMMRDLDEQVIPEETHINYSDLVDWLEKRSYKPGDYMESWSFTEAGIAELVCREVTSLRAASKSDLKIFERLRHEQLQVAAGMLDESEKNAEVQAVLKAKVGEIFRLKEELALCQLERLARVDRPLHIRPRRTLLTIIAALCNAAKIDYTERGASQRIKDMTEHVGAPIDDGTIIKFLREIPDALETRMK